MDKDTITIEVEKAHAPHVLRAYSRCLEKAKDPRSAEVFEQARLVDEALETAEVDRKVQKVVSALSDEGVTEEQVRACVVERQKGSRRPDEKKVEHRIWALLAS